MERVKTMKRNNMNMNIIFNIYLYFILFIYCICILISADAGMNTDIFTHVLHTHYSAPQ
jgi:hypothetical protein